MPFDIKQTHAERVEQTAQIFEKSPYNWSVNRLQNRFSADLIVTKEDVYPEPEFAVVVSSGNQTNAFRKMNPFQETDYYWVFVPSGDRELASVRRDWFRSLGVAYCNVTADKVELIINYSNNDAKLPVDYRDYKYPAEERLNQLGWNPECLEKLEDRYEDNTRAFMKGMGDPPINEESTFDIS